MTSVAVLLPALGRPHRIAPLLESLHASQAEVPLWPLLLLSPGDDEVIEAVRASGEDYAIVDWEPEEGGDYARKINLGYGATDDDWLFMGAVDLAFRRGWADEAIREGERRGKRVIGTQDLGNPAVKRGQHATHILFARSYVAELGTLDGPGKVLHEGYRHWYCDNEAVETAKARGEWVFAGGSVVEHLHPLWGKAETDEVYERAMAWEPRDRALFMARRRLTRGRGRPARVR